MPTAVKDIESYFDALPEERQIPMAKLRKVINDNIPDGFQEVINYNMPGWVVPHSLFPAGYHCDPKLPLPFLNIASQKNFIALYHMGIYADPELLKWWETEYANHCKYKLDMGKSCVRFKRTDDIPYDLIGELISKVTPQQWIETYETNLAGSRRK